MGLEEKQGKRNETFLRATMKEGTAK